MRFVVTGTGRSGTLFAAELFRAAGLMCGHEEYFTADRTVVEGSVSRTAVRETIRRSRTELDGCVSWMAVPRLRRFRGQSFLQLRDPVAVVRSFTGTGFFTSERNAKKQTRFARRYLPPSEDPLLDSMRWWVMWNRWASNEVAMTYRLEAVNAALLSSMLRRIGADDSRAEVIVANATAANTGASRGDRPNDLSWDDLPVGPERDEIARCAAAWGYDY